MPTQETTKQVQLNTKIYSLHQAWIVFFFSLNKTAAIGLHFFFFQLQSMMSDQDIVNIKADNLDLGTTSKDLSEMDQGPKDLADIQEGDGPCPNLTVAADSSLPSTIPTAESMSEPKSQMDHHKAEDDAQSSLLKTIPTAESSSETFEAGNLEQDQFKNLVESEVEGNVEEGPELATDAAEVEAVSPGLVVQADGDFSNGTSEVRMVSPGCQTEEAQSQGTLPISESSESLEPCNQEKDQADYEVGPKRDEETTDSEKVEDTSPGHQKQEAELSSLSPIPTDESKLGPILPDGLEEDQLVRNADKPEVEVIEITDDDEPAPKRGRLSEKTAALQIDKAEFFSSFTSWKVAPDTSPEPDEREAFIQFKSFAKETYVPFIVRDWWSLWERELRLTELEESSVKIKKMPMYSVKKFQTMLDDNFNSKKPREFQIFAGYPNDRRESRNVDFFLETVKETRVMSVKTVGCGLTHLSELDARGQPKPLVLVAFSDLTGKVLFFQDASDLPNRLKQVLSDVSVVKVGSGVAKTCRALERVGIAVGGWVHSEALYKAFLTNESPSGFKAQREYLNREVVKGKFPGYEFNLSWSDLLKSADLSKFRDRYFGFVTSNVRVPLAIACACVVRFAKDRKLSSEFPAFPILWEAFDLARMKVPDDLCEISDIPLENWIAKLPDKSSFAHASRLNSCREVTNFRKSCADFTEVYEDLFSTRLRQEHSLSMHIRGEETKPSLPTRKEANSNKVDEMLSVRCRCCGHPEHGTYDCPKRELGKPLTCKYEHDGLPVPVPHAVSTCPILHRYCSSCFTRGHDASAHVNLQFTQREFRERFLRNQHLGVFTSIPVLAVSSKYRDMMVSDHFRFGLLAQTFRRDALSRFFLSISPSTFLSDAPRRIIEANADQHANWVQEKLDIISFNATMTDPAETIPVPRFSVEKNKGKLSARTSAASSIKCRLGSLLAAGSMFSEDLCQAGEENSVEEDREQDKNKSFDARGKPRTKTKESILASDAV